MIIQQKYSKIEVLLNEIRNEIISEIGDNPYDELDKSISIVSQKNYNQLNLVNEKIKNLSIMLFNRNLDCSKSIFEKLNNVCTIIKDDLS